MYYGAYGNTKQENQKTIPTLRKTMKIYQQRMSAQMDDSFVVFLIGMRINRLWKVHKWLPVARSMGKMLKELHAHPEMGFLGQESWGGRTTIMMQYWRSFDHLEAYAKNREAAHLPAWSAFNKQIANNGDVGIWHETYLIPKGGFECVYNNMPEFGLGKAFAHVPATGPLKNARGRLKQ